jgi:hypothetical protein
MSCNIFGDTNVDIVEVLDSTIKSNIDFDLFITPSFARKKCSYDDLKTKKLVIANYDICTILKHELFPAVEDFVKNYNIDVFILTPHWLLDGDNISDLFEYGTLDYFVNQFRSETEVGCLQYSSFDGIYKNSKDFLRQKSFLVYLGSYRMYRQELCEYLLDKYPDKNWISYVDVNKEKLDKSITEPLDICRASQPKIPNFGLFLSSYFSIIYDTIFEETYKFDDYLNVKFTDKVYRAIRMHHPFLYVGQYRALEKFKELGFKTFDSIIDESYDLIENPQKRLESIIKQVDYIMSKDKKELFYLVRSIEDILVHNFNQIDKYANFHAKSVNNKLIEFLK